MRFKVTVGLPDRPGTLLRTLEQIALNGGNIISIIHNRERITGGYVPVNIQVDFPDQECLERSKVSIESLGIPVLGTETLEKRVETVLILGPSQVGRVVDTFNSLGLKIVGVSVSGLPSSPCLKVVMELPIQGRKTLLDRLEGAVSSLGGLLIREED
ncbi:MAG: hypothetical protein NZ920_02860 [Aigarchaeota archaeon]|nr:hypothetical protein [Aigarchaeota archaeon]MDW8092437.1 hypothetical protein [Nitrososphaerota archaeon]